MAGRLYLDTSAILRAVLESGTSPDLQERVERAEVLITSRLAQVEAARAFVRLRLGGAPSEARLSDAEREVTRVLARCELWELTPAVCDLAGRVTPGMPLRALDALHLATFLLARGRIQGLELVTVDERLRQAAGVA